MWPLLLGVVASLTASGPSAALTVPFALDHNRILVEVQVIGPNAPARHARAWLDLWGSEVLMTGTLARDLRLELPATTGKTIEITLPQMFVGGVAIGNAAVKGRVVVGSRWLVPGLSVDMKLPLTALHRHQVVIDYPGRRLMLAAPGTIPHRGGRVPVTINPTNGMIEIDAEIDGTVRRFVLDGAPYSAVSDALIAGLASRHPDWPGRTGAVGAANVWGMVGEEAWPMLRIGAMRVGVLDVLNIGFVGPPGFIDYYSSQATRPVAGLLGGNLLAAFRVEFDFSAAEIYLEPAGLDRAGDLDLAGLTLKPQADGRYVVLAVASRNGKALVDLVEPGDTLLLVEGVDVTGADMGAVVDRLRGKPGDTRTLVFERNGRRYKVAARVERLM